MWTKEEDMDWGHVDAASLKRYLAIFNAYHLPHVNPRQYLYPSLTPVNTFRIIFNAYFGTSYRLLEDASYIYKGGHPYDFVDVTGL